ncbi:MAG: zinc metallopeptidase [Acidobacteriota bacterium]|nr:zinc metallopeptidase [Acidobacteriota bacterium]
MPVKKKRILDSTYFICLICKTPGNLTDQYDPRKKVLRLSEGIYSSSSLTALEIVAHETGHAIQHHREYFFSTFNPKLFVKSFFCFQKNGFCSCCSNSCDSNFFNS